MESIIKETLLKLGRDNILKDNLLSEMCNDIDLNDIFIYNHGIALYYTNINEFSIDFNKKLLSIGYEIKNINL